jgi:hypothetical protein
VAQQKAMLNRGESPSAQLFAISEDAEIRYSDCGLLYEVRAEEEGRAAAAAAAAAANSSGEAAPATTIGAEESASAPLEKSPAAKGAAVPGDGLPIQVKVDAALDEDSAEDSMALEEMGMIGGGAAEDSGDIAQSRPMSEMSAQLLGRYVQCAPPSPFVSVLFCFLSFVSCPVCPLVCGTFAASQGSEG